MISAILKAAGAILDKIPSWLYALALVALAGYSGWAIAGLKVQLFAAQVNLHKAEKGEAQARLDFSNYKLEQADSRNDQLVTLAKALTNAKTREAESRAAAATADAKSAGLQSTIEEANKRILTAGADAVRDYARTQGQVFQACVREYRALGAAADGHADDVSTLTEAWPKPKSTN